MNRPAPIRSSRRAPVLALVAAAVAGTVLAGPAAAEGWEVRVQEDPFEGTVVTGASVAGDSPGSRFAVECIEGEAGGATRLRLRLVDPAAADATGAARPATELLFRVDGGEALRFAPPEVSPATGVGGGLLVDPDRVGARVGSVLAALRAGTRAQSRAGAQAWVKVRTVGRDYLHAFPLDGAAEALRAPASACAGAIRGSEAASASAAPVVPANDAGVATAGPAPSVAALAASIPPDAMAAAEASLPEGVSMDGLIEHLGTVIGAIEGALETAAAGQTPGAGVEALRDADERLDNFRSLHRRLPAAAKAPLAGIVDAATARLRSLSDSALARPGSDAVLGPAVAPIFESLSALSD